MEVEYKCSTAIGTLGQDESPVDYVRRIGYEIDRIESLMERHITWYTHKNLGAAECPICAIFIVARGVKRVFESFLVVPEEADGEGSGTTGEVEPERSDGGGIG